MIIFDHAKLLIVSFINVKLGLLKKDGKVLHGFCPGIWLIGLSMMPHCMSFSLGLLQT